MPERAFITREPTTTRTTARTVVAVLALALAACAGLWWGPGKGVGTDDAVRQIVEPIFTPTISPWRERLAPPSPSAERLRFSLLGGTALLVLVLALVAPAYAESRRRRARTIEPTDHVALDVETPNSTRWTTHHPAERLLLCTGLLLIAFRHVDPAASALILAVSTTAAVVAGLSLRQWLSWLSLPLGFVALSVIPFAIAAPSSGTTPHALSLVSWWSLNGAKHGAALGLHGLACASAVILLAATTPIHQCALLSRRIGVPALLTDAVILTARLQAVVRTRLVARHRAASFRLGSSSWLARWRTSALLGAGLFLDTAHRASRLERGLELRGGFSTEAVVSAAWAVISTPRVLLVLAVLLLVALLAEFRVLVAP